MRVWLAGPWWAGGRCEMSFCRLGMIWGTRERVCLPYRASLRTVPLRFPRPIPHPRAIPEPPTSIPNVIARPCCQIPGFPWAFPTRRGRFPPARRDRPVAPRYRPSPAEFVQICRAGWWWWSPDGRIRQVTSGQRSLEAARCSAERCMASRPIRLPGCGGF